MCAILHELRDRSFRFEVVAGKLRVSPCERLTNADRVRIRSNRDAILEVLTASSAGKAVQWLEASEWTDVDRAAMRMMDMLAAPKRRSPKQ